jgi:hypothetical protein
VKQATHRYVFFQHIIEVNRFFGLKRVEIDFSLLQHHQSFLADLKTLTDFQLCQEAFGFFLTMKNALHKDTVIWSFFRLPPRTSRGAEIAAPEYRARISTIASPNLVCVYSEGFATASGNKGVRFG